MSEYEMQMLAIATRSEFDTATMGYIFLGLIVIGLVSIPSGPKSRAFVFWIGAIYVVSALFLGSRIAVALSRFLVLQQMLTDMTPTFVMVRPSMQLSTAFFRIALLIIVPAGALYAIAAAYRGRSAGS